MTVESSGLIAALARTERLVRRLDEAGELVDVITAEQAIAVVKHGAYVGITRGRNGQIRSVRPVSTKLPMTIRDAFPGRPVLWTIGYARATKGSGTRRLAA